jgi:hypothetical protein
MPKRMYDSIQMIDLGGYLPILDTEPERFLALHGYPGLRSLVLSYVPKGSTGATVDLLFVQSFGLFDNIANGLKIFVTIASLEQRTQFFDEIKTTVAKIRTETRSAEQEQQLVKVLSQDLSLIDDSTETRTLGAVLKGEPLSLIKL